MSKIVFLQHPNPQIKPNKIILYGVNHCEVVQPELMETLIIESAQVLLEIDHTCPQISSCPNIYEAYKTLKDIGKIAIPADIRCQVFNDMDGTFRQKVYQTQDWTNQDLMKHFSNLTNSIWSGGNLDKRFGELQQNSEDNRWAKFTPKELLKDDFNKLRPDFQKILFFRWVHIGSMLRKFIEKLEKDIKVVFEKLQIMQIVASVTDYSFSCYMLRCNDCNTVISIIGNAHVSGVETESPLEWQGISGFLQSRLGYKIVKDNALIKESNAATGLLNISRNIQKKENNAVDALFDLMNT
jgi:hypothetical protein